MTKFFFYLSIVCLCLTFVSCNDDDDKVKIERGEVVIDGKEYAIKSVEQIHYGTYDSSNNLEKIELQFILEDGNKIYFQTLVNGSEKLKAGTYSFSDSYRGDLTIRYAEFYVENKWYDMEEAMMSVSINKDTYTIYVEGEYEDGDSKKITIDYKGTIGYTSYVVAPNGQGTLTHDGETYDVNIGVQYYYGEYDGFENVDLLIYDEEEEVEIYFEMFINSGNKLVAGTYTYSEETAAMTFSHGEISMEGNYSYIGDGEIKVSVSGNTYTINGEGEDRNGNAYSFTYKGELKWFDNRDDDEGNYAPQRTKATIQKKR